jgi:transcriptional regulator with XRE-family HTH domain
VSTLTTSTQTQTPWPPLRTVRKAQGLSLAQVAERSGVDIGHLSRIERGQAGLSIDTLARLAKALGLHELERMLEQYRRDDPSTKSASPAFDRAQGSREGTSNERAYQTS